MALTGGSGRAIGGTRTVRQGQHFELVRGTDGSVSLDFAWRVDRLATARYLAFAVSAFRRPRAGGASNLVADQSWPRRGKPDGGRAENGSAPG